MSPGPPPYGVQRRYNHPSLGYKTKEENVADYRHIEVERRGAVALGRLINPPQNLMNAAMVAELGQLAQDVEGDAEVRALVLTGGVTGIFITHYDVSELVRASDAARRAEQPAQPSTGELHPVHQTFNRLQSLPKPVIAAINGVAMGGGCELALACDFRFMARGGLIGLPEVRVGILPGAGGTQRLARILGTARALELILLGKVVTADEAAAIGMVHRALEPDELLPYALEFAAELAGRPPTSVAQIKRCIHEGAQLPLMDGLRLEQECFWNTMRSDDALRLMRDYVEGRLGPLSQS